MPGLCLTWDCPMALAAALQGETELPLHYMLIQTYIPVHQDMHLHEVQRPYTGAIWRRLPILQMISSIPALHESEA